MRRWMVVVVVSAWSVHAEQWADEPVAAPSPESVEPPLVGFIAGGELAVGRLTNDGPALGLRLGARFRVAQHLSLGVLFDWQVVSWFNVVPGTPSPAPGDQSLRERALAARGLQPERLRAPAGAGAERRRGPHLAGQVGLHAGLTRLRPSGWWFPLFAEVLSLFGDQAGFVQLLVGVGL